MSKKVDICFQGLRIEKGPNGTVIQTEEGGDKLIGSFFKGLAELIGTILRSKK